MYEQVNKLDWLVFNAALFCVAFLGVEIGLAIAIGLSIAIVLYKTAFPHTAVLGRLPQTSVYRQATYSLCPLTERILRMGFDGALEGHMSIYSSDEVVSISRQAP